MNLLDYIVDQSDCSYISDLKRTDKWKVVLLTLKKDKKLEELFSIDDWNHCVDYLSKKENPEHFNTAKEAIEYLLKE